MTGATETGAWSIETLKQLIDERQVSQRREIDALTREFHEHIEAARQETQFALNASDKAIAKAEISTEKAIEKAAAATETRFASVNEFRAQLSDQAQLFMPRAESLSLHGRADERITQLSQQAQSFMSRADTEALLDRNAERLQDLTDRLNRSEGKGLGLNAGWVYALGALAALGTLVSFFVLLNK